MSSLNRGEFEFLHVKGGQDHALFNGHSILHFDSATGCLALGRLQKIHLQVTDGSPCSRVEWPAAFADQMIREGEESDSEELTEVRWGAVSYYMHTEYRFLQCALLVSWMSHRILDREIW